MSEANLSGDTSKIDVTSKEDTSATREDTSATREDISATKQDTSPTREDTSASKQDTSATREDTSTTRNGSGTEEPSSKRARIESSEVADSATSSGTIRCPYLDTIDRAVLDFDFEKLCSISLSNNNVYACLVCGKYFQGRGIKSHAYTHSVQLGHHVFLNLLTHRFFCLPDNYEIRDTSLADINHQLDPKFTPEDIATLDTSDTWSRSLTGVLYLPGVTGLNNIKSNDYMNAVLQGLSHVTEIRNYFLQESNYAGIKRPPGDQLFILVTQFGALMRKLWNKRNFKAHVSPHEMLQAVVHVSRKKFQITKQGDAIEFLAWLLNSLHRALGGTKKVQTVVTNTFQGHLKIYSKRLPNPTDDTELDLIAQTLLLLEAREECEECPFLYLTLDLPPPPLFHDEMDRNSIPQVSLSELFSKFDTKTQKEYRSNKETVFRRFEITTLPPYLILYIRRFTKNIFYTEKNPTIVNFPIKQLDLTEFVSKNTDTLAVYNLVANVVHDGTPNGGSYRIHLQHRGAKHWFEIQDLHVTDLLPEMISLSEAYIQIYELCRD